MGDLPAPCFRADAAGLWSNPHRSQAVAMRAALSVVLAAIGAYALSFALDLLFGAMLGTYPSTAFLPVLTWSVIATVCYLVALRLERRPGYVVWPTAAIALLTVLAAVIGHHRQNWVVAAAMVIQTVLLWRGLRPTSIAPAAAS